MNKECEIRPDVQFQFQFQPSKGFIAEYIELCKRHDRYIAVESRPGNDPSLSVAHMSESEFYETISQLYASSAN